LSLLAACYQRAPDKRSLGWNRKHPEGRHWVIGRPSAPSRIPSVFRPKRDIQRRASAIRSRSDVQAQLLSAKAATLTDVERKLAIVSGWNGWHEIQTQTIDALLADVRSLMGEAS
jgi:hypothetical protein